MAPQPLTPDRIVAEALALLQESGLEAVSLRRLAARLGVQAMSIYWHIANKDELLRQMSQKVFQDSMSTMPECQSWQDWARVYGLGLWDMYHRVRDAARLTFSVRYSDDDFRQIGDSLAAYLTRFGLDAGQAIQLHSSIQALVIGWAGFDHTFGEPLGRLIEIEPAMGDSLDALIKGWDLKLAMGEV